MTHSILKGKLKPTLILGIVFVAILGTVGHFFYQWSGENPLIGLFFPINESTWEHLKLIYFPMILFTAYATKQLKKDYPCITTAMLTGALFGTFLIPILFYTYSGILGFHIQVLDISTFYISVLAAFYLTFKIAQNCNEDPFSIPIMLATVILGVCFILFTYYPPNLGIFEVPS